MPLVIIPLWATFAGAFMLMLQLLNKIIILAWIKPAAEDPYQAYCSFCSINVTANKKSLVEHAKSAEHQLNKPEE